MLSTGVISGGATSEAPALRALPPLRIGPHRVGRPIVLAPMAGVSEAPFRAMVLRMGAGLAPTELVSAKGLKYGNARTEAYLRHDPADEPLLSVQVFGGDPESMALAAELAAERGAKMLDVNMGCPVKKVTRHGAGSALMTDPPRAASIIAAMRARVGDAVPITAKIRAGWDDAHKNAAEVGRALEGAGAAAIAIHPRTRKQAYTGRADWRVTRELADAVSVPVIANGDIFTVADADRAVRETGCQAVMIGRAALGNPWIFERLVAAYDGRPLPAPPVGPARAAFVRAHLAAHLEHHGDLVRGLKKFRQHLIWYSRGMREGASFRQRVTGLEARAPVEDAIDDFLGRDVEQNLEEAAIYDERAALG
jgi:nifR3 family TIM-barrel protein